MCDCGKTTVLRIDYLKNGNTVSCGCIAEQTLNAGRTELKKAFVDGTRQISPARKLNSNNKTGVKGVCWSSRKQKYRAQITFKAKVYHLGFYDKLEDATKARKQSEKNMFDPFVAEQQDLVAQVSLESTVKLLLIVELNRAEQERLTFPIVLRMARLPLARS